MRNLSRPLAVPVFSLFSLSLVRHRPRPNREWNSSQRQRPHRLEPWPGGIRRRRPHETHGGIGFTYWSGGKIGHCQTPRSFSRCRDSTTFRRSTSRIPHRAARTLDARSLRLRIQIDNHPETSLARVRTRFKLELVLIVDCPEVDASPGCHDDVRACWRLSGLARRRQRRATRSRPDIAKLALDELRSDAERKRPRRDVCLFPGLPVVTVKPASFKRCLANLVSTAARHANAISIKGNRDHRYLTITIDDDGPGIPQQMREEVFKPFCGSTTPATRTKAAPGLPLAIRRDIARSHGGRHHARRQSDGRTSRPVRILCNGPGEA